MSSGVRASRRKPTTNIADNFEYNFALRSWRVGAAGDVTMPEVQLSAYAAGTSPLSTHGVVAEQYLQDAPNCQPAQGLSAERAAAHSAQHAAADAAGSRCVVLP